MGVVYVSMNTQQTEKPEGASEFLQIDVMIKRYLADIKKLREDMKVQRELFNDSFKNDAEYHDTDEKVKEVSKKKTDAKRRITQLPSVKESAEKIKGIREELKDAQDSLSAYLQMYVKQTGATTLETDEGEVLKIVPAYKLVKDTER